MAAAGTITQSYTTYRQLQVSISGVPNAAESFPFRGKALPYSSFVVSGTFASASVQAQGSNDGGTTWINIGMPVTSAGGATLTPDETTFDLYQFAVTGGGASTTINVDVRFSASGI